MSLLIIGLTGQTGAGKSTVSKLFREAGLNVIDCDNVSRLVTRKGEPALDAIAEAFSPAVLTESGELDRKALGNLVFNDADALDLLNRTIFPFIFTHLENECKALEESGESVVILDAPTLFESGADKLCLQVLGVCADKELRKERIMQRDGLTEEEAVARMNSQHSEEFFRTHCRAVIENSGDPEALRRQVETTISQLIAMSKTFSK